MSFIAGYNKGVTFRPSGAGGFTTLNVTGWSWKDTGEKLDVSHTGSFGQQALIAGLQRGQGNVTANLDTVQIPSTNPPNLRFGTKGVITFDEGGATNWQVPIMITAVNYKSEVAGKVEYNFDVELDQISGTLTYPT